jgi:serine/threonine protein kinase
MNHQVDSKSIIVPLSCVRKETDMLSSLNHPNIVKTFGFCLDPPCVLVEKAPLGNLYQKLMDTEVKISRTVRFHIACQVASALSYLHRRDIIYRTLKASSILLWSLDFNCNASVKLANFERAAYQSPSGLMSKTTFSSYPAQEMLRYSFREEKVDIYSFGMLLYELVTRWLPYGETSNGAHSQKPKLSGMMTTGYSTIVN